MLPIYTFGHSNHGLPRFFELLRSVEIKLVIDVRSTPASGRYPYFNKGPLSASVERAGLGYRFSGDVLGGMPNSTRFYDDEGYVLYGEIAATDGFQQAIASALADAETQAVCLMCGEENPAGCHRRHMLARVLTELGATVLHLRGDGRAQSEQQLSGPAQIGLFGPPTGRAWRSLKPVRRD
jgi:uncharacterized protein (DUF488 family)